MTTDTQLIIPICLLISTSPILSGVSWRHCGEQHCLPVVMLGRVGDTTDKARTRIVRRATELFRAEGFGAVGVDRISDLAPVSKRTLYQRFPTKDDLIAEYVRTIGDTNYDSMQDAVDDDAPPAERILQAFIWLQNQTTPSGYRGCPIVNAVAELPDATHPARQLALDHKDQVLGFFRDQAASAGAADPDELAEQLIMLFDGASSYSLVRDSRIPPSFLAAAKTLINAQLPPDSQPLK
ncbi:TetR/AcrR family transcriptional regulator [Actinoplanes sp. TBRC 11911]|uniref:TetR/AcrR family transcriptional regulator n=1 Tax=Actinoplanes sp. TBRC 11911 TaxID=2729386 RepID=UPI00145F2275|nr:TetR/AcrR family transcriptional regulator [Actinoplanes sp. TBRC 11911]NMO54992.1 TetR/AcrR family transcriptional regulator [Actinoplanes sp. TBRC 11911]